MKGESLAHFCRRHGLGEDARAELDDLVREVSLPPEDDAPTLAVEDETVRVELPEGPGFTTALQDFRSDLDEDDLVEEPRTERVLADDPVLGDLGGAPPTAAFDLDDLPATLPGSAESPAPDEGLDALIRLLPVTPAHLYDDLGLIGRGGTGEVRRVLDRRLDRTLAMKITWPRLQHEPAQLRAFLDEARTGARLDHPGTLPVHELGRFDDGRLYFTMPEIRGRTLGAALHEVHAASGPEGWHPSPDGWTFRRLIRAFLRVCETIAYAHDEAVLHRDLKPANIMVNDHDVVLVVDWGLARRTDAEPRRGRRTIAGTPAYMPPEQARGDLHLLDERADVYALGAILYELLTGRPPYEGPDARDVLRQVVHGPPPPPGEDTAIEQAALEGSMTSSLFERLARRRRGPPVPDALREACLAAMAREPQERPRTVQALIAPVSAWLEGTRKREQALTLIEQADRLLPEADRVRERALSLDDAARRRLAEVPAWAPETDKRDAWALDAEAESLARHAHMLDLLAEQKLQAALVHDPDLPEAHARLAERWRAAHAEAEARRDEGHATRCEMMLRRHVGALPEDHPDAARHLAWLAGTGTLTLLTEPAAQARLLRFEKRHRRLVPVAMRQLGETPIRDLTLPMGSYVVQLRATGRAPVTIPVLIEREGTWDARPPDRDWAHVHELPAAHTLTPDEALVPAGWFQAGGDSEAVDAMSARWVWADAFVMMRDPVTTTQWTAWLDALARTAGIDAALEHAPRSEAGELLVARGRDGTFRPLPDTPLLEDGPVVGVTWRSARAFATWTAERTGKPWRLPAELEWEKAARGVDGRFYPWGDWLDPSWAVIADTDPGATSPRALGSTPVDVSPYGIRGLAGNTQDWCLDPWHVDGGTEPWTRLVIPQVDDAVETSRVYRGGHWRSSHRMARAAARHHRSVDARFRTLGVRLVRSV